MATLQDYRQRPHWSFSAINQFLNICSLQFAFDRVYRLEKTFTPVTLSFGSAFHRTLEWLHAMKRAGAMPPPAAIDERFRDFWARQLTEDQNVRLEQGVGTDDYAAQGAALVNALAAASDPEEEVLTINEAFAVPLIDSDGQALEKPMVGEFDLRVRKNGQSLIVDWKTSARRWPKDQAAKSLQPTVYGYAHTLVHGENADTRFDVAVKAKTPVIEQHRTRRDADDFDRLVMLVARIESMIAAEHFLPSEQGFYCGGCPHQEACRAWHRHSQRVSVRMAA